MNIAEVSVPERHVRELGTDHGVITCGTYYYTDRKNPSRVKEKVDCWCKDVVYEFLK
jgi:hypothetical protein